MQQIIEGLDNEVALLLFFTTAVVALVFPLYIVKLFHPTEERLPQEGNYDQPIPPQPETVTERNDNQPAPPPPEITINASKRNDNNPQSETNQPIPSIFETAAEVQGSVIDNITHANNVTSAPTAQINEELPPINFNKPNEDPPIESFVIRVKFHEETQEQRVTHLVKLKELKQRCFPEQFSEGKQIRFIHAGKVLQGDDSTLQQLGIARPCVLQCVISEQNNTARASEGSSAGTAGNIDNELLDLSSLVYICYGVLIIGSWTLLFLHDDWFSNFGMFILSILSVIAYFLLF